MYLFINIICYMLEILSIKFQSNLAFIAQLACLYMLEMVFCYILHLNLYSQIIKNILNVSVYKYHLLYVRNNKYHVLVKFSFYSTISMFIYVGNGVLLYITTKLIQLDTIKFQSNLTFIVQLTCLYMLEMVFCYILHLNLYSYRYFKCICL